MFISLNKKFIYAILLFFLFISTLFIYTFYQIYGVRFQEEQQSNLSRNQQYIELLYKNVEFRNELKNLINNNPGLSISENIKKEINAPEDKWKTALSSEKKKITEITKNYDDKYSAIKQGLKIVGIGSVLLIFAIIIMYILMQRWILAPLNKISEISSQVAQGKLNRRITNNPNHFFIDEIDILSQTFNSMLDKLENNINEIKEKENFLQSLIDGIPDGIRVIDENYNIIIANKEYYRLAGKRKCQKCYEASQKRLTPCPEHSFSCPLKEILTKKKEKIKVIQQFIKSPNRHLSINAAPLQYTSGREKLIVEVIRDLSEDIKFSHQQKISSLGFLATSVAHEMKNHLGSIKIITENLLNKSERTKQIDNDQIKLIALIHNQLTECINVPERLLKLAKHSDDELKKINCAENVKDVMALLDYEAKRNGISIEMTEQEQDISIYGYEADFKMIIVNLLLNAIKAISQNGKIQIDISKQKKETILKVSDNGHGIPEDKLHRIFEPFYSENKTQNSSGTGLGLSIVKAIVEKFKGSISVSSKYGKGSCFTIKFPQLPKK